MNPLPQPVDWEQLDVIAFDYAPEFVDIYREFADGVPGMIDALEAAAAEGSLDAIVKAAHKIKGSALNFGFAALGGIAAATESDARDGRAPGDVPGLVAALRDAFSRATEEVRQKKGF